MIPICKHKGCKQPVVPQGNECARHWMLSRGWNTKKGEYLPFAENVSDPNWDDSLEKTTQDQAAKAS